VLLDMEADPKSPSLVASTANMYCCSVSESEVRERQLQDTEAADAQSGPIPAEYGGVDSNYFKSAQW
jgi:hypothetical protein